REFSYQRETLPQDANLRFSNDKAMMVRGQSRRVNSLRSSRNAVVNLPLSVFDRKTPMKLFCLAPMLLGLCASSALTHWQQQTIRSDADFRGLCAVTPNI